MARSEQQTPKDKNFTRIYAMAFEMVILNVILIVGGLFLDRFLGSSPLFILLGVFLATGGTIWLLVKATR